MPICIECRYPVTQLYTSYSKADDRSLGRGVRLTQCPRCKRFADKYVEHDFVVLFIDLVLIKPQVYRHLLFNRLGRDDDQFDPSIVRFGILLLLFDVYLTWVRIEKASSGEGGQRPSALHGQPLGLQYLFFLILCSLRTLAFHLPIGMLASSRVAGRPLLSSVLPHYPHRARISSALLVSSCTKLFPILLIVWDYDLPSSASAVSWAVMINNVAALEILMDCGYLRAMALVTVGTLAGTSAGQLLLSAVGLHEAGNWNIRYWLDAFNALLTAITPAR